MVPEAPMEDGPEAGSRPATGGSSSTPARRPGSATRSSEPASCSRAHSSSRTCGVNIQVVHPGQPNCYYHGEEGQEDFLVLSGECLLLIEEDRSGR